MENSFIFVPLLLAIGIAAGAFSGFLGIGGGLIMVPALAYVLKSQAHAQGISLSVMLPPITIMACLHYWQAHPLKEMTYNITNWLLITYVCLGFFFGSYFGGKMAVVLDEVILKKCFSIFLIIFAIYTFFQKP